jgi:very-short-patch-repair endonuclease
VAQELRTVEQKVAWIASRAHGVVTRAELLDAAITSDEIVHRLQTGSLIAVFRGVYRVGHAAPSVEARFMAAVKAAGKRGVLSGLAAAHLFGLVKGASPPPEVIAPTERRIKGVGTSCRHLDGRDTTVWRGIPVTSVPRTLVDLASLLSLGELARAFHEANVRYRTTPAHVEETLERAPRAKRRARLLDVMRGDAHVILSRLERRFLKFLRDHSLPLPRTNRPAGSHYVDCRWPDHELTVELDSYRYHNTRHAWEQDRRREREAYARGDSFRRFTWEDVTERPSAVLSELRALLS